MSQKKPLSLSFKPHCIRLTLIVVEINVMEVSTLAGKVTRSGNRLIKDVTSQCNQIKTKVSMKILKFH